MTDRSHVSNGGKEFFRDVFSGGRGSSDDSETDDDLADDEDPALEPVEEAPVDQPEQMRRGSLSTGIDLLDRRLNGGIPPGRMVAFVAPPDTQSELLLKELTTTRDTLYLSTFRPKWEIEEEFRDFLTLADSPDGLPHQIHIEHVSPDSLLEEPDRYLRDLGEGSNLIIDSINEFELEDRSAYLQFLNTVKLRLWDTGSVGLCYGIEDDGSPISRSLTLKRADIVWRLQSSVESQGISTYLVISKFRGGKALTEPIKLVLTDEVEIDTSRDIA